MVGTPCSLRVVLRPEPVAMTLSGTWTTPGGWSTVVVTASEAAAMFDRTPKFFREQHAKGALPAIAQSPLRFDADLCRQISEAARASARRPSVEQRAAPSKDAAEHAQRRARRRRELRSVALPELSKHGSRS